MQLTRWQSLMDAFGFAPNETTFNKLAAAYSEKHRYYHAASHIVACLNHLDRCEALAENAAEIELALWFHDAIYKPFRGDNELASANWAVDFLQQNKASEGLAQRIHRLIMVTEHNAPTQTADESLLVDIDLSILGTGASVYEQFEVNVRKEYKRIPMFIYKKKRAEVLKSFLERPQIYNNEPFRSNFEEAARRNISAAINRLTGSV